MNPKKRKSGFNDFIKTDRAILMICIGIALVFWLFTKMANEYESELGVDVNFVVPEGKILSSPPPEKIHVRFIAGGWDLFLRHLRNRSSSVDIPLDITSNQNVSPRLQEILIEEALKGEYKVEGTSLVNIALKIENRDSIKLPLELVSQVNLAAQYQLASPLTISPDSVLMTGPESLIRNYSKWYTVPLSVQNLDVSKEFEVKIQQHENNQISFSPTSVKTKVEIEQYTEKKFEVPVSISGSANDAQIMLFKRSVNVTCIIGLSKYEAVSADQFELVADFTNINLTSETFAPVKIIRKPEFVKNVHIDPDKIEFYLRK